MKKKRSGVVSSLKMIHSNSMEGVESKICSARTALLEATADLQELSSVSEPRSWLFQHNNCYPSPLFVECAAPIDQYIHVILLIFNSLLHQSDLLPVSLLSMIATLFPTAAVANYRSLVQLQHHFLGQPARFR